MRILAVDDDPVFLDVLVQMLRTFGREDITTVSSAAKALKALKNRSQTFDCILLDIQMPGTSGVELCSTIRAMDAYRRTPIVMITAMSAKSFIDDAFAAGATDYVTKPLDPLELKARLGMVERLLDERRHMTALTQQVSRSIGALEIQVEFDTPIMVPGFDRSIEYLALENYLLTLGIKRMFSLAAVGFTIENASLIFRKASPSAFINMLGDVATVIADTLKTDQVLMAYAGSGNFVGVAKQELSAEPEDMEMMINIGLMDFENIYQSDRLPLPQVKVGPLVRSSFFSLASPTKILDRAITLAQPGSEKKPRPKLYAA